MEQNCFVFPTSYSQRRLCFLDQLEPGLPTFNIAAPVKATGPLNVSALEQSLNEIIRRQESLRTTFAYVDGQPVQVIAQSLSVALSIIELQQECPEAIEERAVRLAGEESRRPFDLARGPLLRFSLIRLRDNESMLLLTIHHVVSDGWSMGVFMRELASHYEAFTAGESSPLPELPITYADYVIWLQDQLQTEAFQKQLSYWKERLTPSSPPLELPTDRPRPASRTSLGAKYYLWFDKPLLDNLKLLGRQEGCTLFMPLLAAYQSLLHRYCGQVDISVGSSVAGRDSQETEDLIGFFLNTLVLRTDLSGNPSFRELLRSVRDVALDSYANQDVPIELIIETVRPDRALSHNPLFQVMFIFQNTPRPPLKLSDATMTLLDIDGGTAKFDLTLDLVEKPDGLGGWLEYSTDLFDAGTIARMGRHFRLLLESIIINPDRRLSDLDFLTEQETRQLRHEWNSCGADYSCDKSVRQLFDEQVERTPNKIAAVFKDGFFTFQELEERSSRLSSLLKELNR